MPKSKPTEDQPKPNPGYVSAEKGSLTLIKLDRVAGVFKQWEISMGTPIILPPLFNKLLNSKP